MSELKEFKFIATIKIDTAGRADSGREFSRRLALGSSQVWPCG